MTTECIRSNKSILKIVTLSVIVSFSTITHADTKYKETRYCDSYERSSSVVRAFKKMHPCPATGKTSGSCSGWSVDHVIPIAVGGCDSVSNLQWLPNEIKSCAGTICKDRWERKVYKRLDETP